MIYLTIISCTSGGFGIFGIQKQHRCFTLRAAFSPLACVDERVFLHVGLLMEPLAAVLAGVRPRVRVDEQVRGQRGGALEGFATHLALEALFLIKRRKHVQKHCSFGIYFDGW